MSERSERRGFAARPTNPDAWIKAADRRSVLFSVYWFPIWVAKSPSLASSLITRAS